MKKLLLLGAATAVLGLTAPAQAEGDPAKGQNVFKQCAMCHQAGKGAANKIGPQLNGLFGRVAGTAPGFTYSPAMIKAGKDGLVWNEETLAKHLRNPQGFVKGNRMPFAGLRSDADIANVLAYLKQFSQK